MAPFMDRDKVIFLEVVEVHFHKNDLYWTRFPSIIRRTRLQTSSQYCRTKRCGVCISCLSGTRNTVICFATFTLPVLFGLLQVTKPSAQIGFIRFVLIPLFEALGQLFPVLEVTYFFVFLFMDFTLQRLITGFTY